MFIEVESPTPILNTPEFEAVFGGVSGREIPTNAKGHPLHNEFVALEGTLFHVEDQIDKGDHSIYRVSCPFYPGPHLYIDSRFTKAPGAARKKAPLTPEQVLDRMQKLTGTPYTWGGNWSRGILRLLELYPPRGPIDERTRTYWCYQGIDCSGLLYEATNGSTPRNTSQLNHFGRAVRDPSLIQPLDMILYPGHVIFALTPTTTIESKWPYGVIQRNLQDRLAELKSEHFFTIRRFTNGSTLLDFASCK
jgi:cell wall-associated NlpC family hydrolase